MKSHKFFLVIVVFFFFCTIVKGQTTQSDSPKPFIGHQFNISFSGSIVWSQERINQNRVVMGPRIEGLYGINNWLESGLFVNGFIYTFGSSNSYESYHPVKLLYGVESKAHLLPAIIKPSFSLFDVYGVAKFGACTLCPNGCPELAPSSCFFISGGAGAAINLSRHFGVFFEWEYGNLKACYLTIGLNFRLGVTKK